MAQPCHHNICPAARAAKYNSTTCGEQRAIRLENVRQGLGEGQWVQRHDGRVLLRMNSTVPQPQEGNVSHPHIHGELVAANGAPQILLTPRSQGLLRGAHISVTGVRLVLSAFSGTATAAGWPDTQAGNAATGIRDGKAAPRGQVCPVLAAIVTEQGHVSNCSFAHLGGAGVHLRSGVVEDSTFSDLSGGAVLLGTHDPETPSRGEVRCNVIQHIGVEYTGSTGIAAGYMRGALIRGNLLAHLPYTAISMGWGWGQYSMCPARTGSLPGCTAAGDNVIESNAVLTTDICQVNGDGGAIYTLGQQPNSSIRRNCLAGAHRGYEECMAIYNDDGSFGITSEANKVSVGSRYLIKGANPDPSKGNPTRGTRALACRSTGTTLPRVTDLPANEPGPYSYSSVRALAAPPSGFITDPNAMQAQCGDEYVCAATIQEVCPGSSVLLVASAMDIGVQ